MRPGTNVTVQSQLPPTSPPINTGTWFVAGIASQGPTAPQTCTSFAQWQAVYGARGTNPILSDSVETYFAQGGSRVVTARVVGPAAATATITLKDTGAANSLIVSAIGPGTYANGMKVVVATVTGGYTITIEDSNSNTLEASNTLVTVADAVAYGATSQYVTVTAAGVNAPVAITTALAGGVDDTASITVTQYSASLALFVSDFGPGQVSVPGNSAADVQTAVVGHCSTYNRRFLLDTADTATAATLIAAATTIRALGTQARNGGIFTPWLDIAPVSGTAGNRGVPASAFVAGKMAKNDATSVSPSAPYGNPNLPCAGVNGILDTPVAAHATFSDIDRQSLNTAGVNVIRPMAGGFRIYGNVTAVDRLKDPLYFMLSNVRLDMAVQAQGGVVQEDYMFSQLDGNGVDIADFGNDLGSMMTNWQTAGALFPNDQGVFFTVDTGADVNTPTTESQGQLLATIAYARAPGAEQVNLNIVRASAATGV